MGIGYPVVNVKGPLSREVHSYLDRVVVIIVLQGTWGLGGKVTGEI